VTHPILCLLESVDPSIEADCVNPDLCGRAIQFIGSINNQWNLTFRGDNLPVASDLAFTRVLMSITIGATTANCASVTNFDAGFYLDCIIQGNSPAPLPLGTVTTITLQAFGMTVKNTAVPAPAYFVTQTPTMSAGSCPLSRCRLTRNYPDPVPMAFPITNFPTQQNRNQIELFQFKPRLTTSTSCTNVVIENNMLKCNFTLSPLVITAEEAFPVLVDVTVYGITFSNVATGYTLLPSTPFVPFAGSLFFSSTKTFCGPLLDYSADDYDKWSSHLQRYDGHLPSYSHY
jgi:hypothetical protein